ncbi:MAG: glutamate synthase large subunit, partial [Proteobacteria bacterium]|nr:glutamate synthase large subunit [Pseudomonadota bacterium]
MNNKRVDGNIGFPDKHGLYDPANEKDSCGVGFVANIKGIPSHEIMTDAYHINSRMDHRGGCGFEENTGDGAGILAAISHKFFTRVLAEQGITLPEPKAYAIGNVFLPRDPKERAHCKEVMERIIHEEGQQCLGFREVPICPDEADIGPAAREAMPFIEQVIIEGTKTTDHAFDRALYLIRRRFIVEAKHESDLEEAKQVYVCSLNSRIIVYKGMLTPGQLFPFYPDLEDPDYESHLAMVHSRFSTNTFPSWARAQPNRFMSHNGEINTLRGNRNNMTAREGVVKSEKFGDRINDLFPIVQPGYSDSGTFDNVLEFLLMSGKSLQEAVMMMIPEAWQADVNMPQEKRDFYEYHSALMEPWDGPASIVFTDGHYIGAVLDRNGLRPSRYYVTHDDKVVMASEVGVLPIDPANVKEKGRLQPGKMFLVDFFDGRLIPDEELKMDFATRRPYGQWIEKQKIELSDLPKSGNELHYEPSSLVQRMQSFGYTVETMQFMLLPLVTEARDPLGSMGNDSALACLSDKSRMIYDYFKQLFAQITNPPIDSIREEVVMSLACFIGPEGNLLETTEEHIHRISLPHPILSNDELASIKNMSDRGWKTQTIDITFEKWTGKTGMLEAIDRICSEATAAIEDGFSIIVLSDRNISADRMALSSLIACGAVHHHLVGTHQRTRIGIVIESGEAREVHHHCLLVGYGADAINPYVAFESLWQAQQDGLLDAAEYPDIHKIVASYKKGIAKGILKVMAKMGISTLQSYKGAQIFEAVGLAEEIIDRCFIGTTSRVQGVSFDVLFYEMKLRHEIGYPPRNGNLIPVLPNPGDFHWRSGGDTHMWDPETISNLQVAARTNNEDAYWQFANHANGESTRRATFRGLLDFKYADTAIELDEVEAASEIVKRFCTGAMSFGSISAESHEALAIAMNRLGGKSNTGEGGEDPIRFETMENGDSKRSAIKQVASGRFGVTIWYLANADELQIKIVQGAKPGEGGELPGPKVDKNIARIRHSTPGVGLISPPPHHDIYSIEDIAQLIHDLKNANPKARISVKLGSEIGVGTIAAGVTKAKADHLVIAGHDGGTGASPLTSIKHAGLPWELGLAETHQTLVMNNLRSRVVLQTDGQIKTGRDVAIALLLGAEEIGFATAPLVTLGCIMMRKCHLNTCPVGVATQDPELRKKFKGKPEHVVNYLFMVAEEMRGIMAQLGIRTVNEMIGRVDLLDTDDAIDHWKASG